MKRFCLAGMLAMIALLAGESNSLARPENQGFPYTANSPPELSQAAIFDLVKRSKLIVEGTIHVASTLDGHQAALIIDKVLLGQTSRASVRFISAPDWIPTGRVILFFSSEHEDTDGFVKLVRREAPWMANPDQEKTVIAAVRSLSAGNGPHGPN